MQHVYQFRPAQTNYKSEKLDPTWNHGGLESVPQRLFSQGVI